ncbi:MAG: D-alanyl-D-alanine carboxypeptidase [Clostridia bacterium]|nr:D-alanyl-D-alanine carboxypeptidase [Clostridia bacterium]
MKKIKILLVLFVFCFALTGLNKSVTIVNANTGESKASFLMDYNSGTVISKHNENERLKIASMTKIMLLLLCYENIEAGALSLDETIVVSKNASNMGGSQVFLEENGEYLVKDLIKSIIVSSANDASVAMAERLYGSEENCVKKMNEKAESLNLKNTLFSNCTGLPKPMQYSSAKDVALIFKELIKHSNYFEYSKIWLDKIDHKNNSTELANTNKLVKFYDGCDGGKTGYTSEAGFCLTATAKRGNMRLIAVVIGSPTSKDRFGEVSKMFNNGFNNYENKAVVDVNSYQNEFVKVKNGEVSQVEIKPKNNFYVFSKKGEDANVLIEQNVNKVCAPLKCGEKVGEIVVYSNGTEIGRVDLVSTKDVKKLNFFGNVLQILKEW